MGCGEDGGASGQEVGGEGGGDLGAKIALSSHRKVNGRSRVHCSGSSDVLVLLLKLKFSFCIDSYTRRNATHLIEKCLDVHENDRNGGFHLP